jgi:cell division protein FtsL
MKKYIVLGITVVLLLVGVMGFDDIKRQMEISKIEKEIERLENMTVEEYTASDEYKQEHPDMSSYLKVSELRSTHSAGLYKMTGKMTNTSNVNIDSIGEMVIFDKQGNMIEIKYMDIKLKPNQSMYFDEIVGTELAGDSIILQNFENY